MVGGGLGKVGYNSQLRSSKTENHFPHQHKICNSKEGGCNNVIFPSLSFQLLPKPPLLTYHPINPYCVQACSMARVRKSRY